MSLRQTWERRIRRWSRRSLSRFGALGLAGIALLVVAAALGAYAPQLEQEAEDLHEEVARMRGRLDEVRRDLSQRPGSREQASQLRQSFPTVDHATADLRVIFEIAEKNKVVLAKGEYALATTGDSSRLRRFDVTLPVRERYVTLKSFIAGVLNAVPHASLAEVRIERSAANVDQLDARVHFTLFYREG